MLQYIQGAGLKRKRSKRAAHSSRLLKTSMGVVGLRMTEAERQARIAAIIDEFTLMDDAFMSEVFDGQNEIVELLLRIILQRDDLVVTSVKTQHEYKSSTMRSVKLDVRAVDASGKI